MFAMQDTAKTEKPPKLIRITQNEAIRMQWNLIKEWQPRSDVWPFTYGIGILAGTSAFVGTYFNSFYRKALRLGHYGLRSSYLPAAILPMFCTAAVHGILVSSDILIGETHCSTCIWTRATSLQVAMGVVYPLTITPLASFYLAATYYTYKVPQLTQTTELLKLWWRISKPKFGQLYIIAAMQIVVASIITYQEMIAIQRISATLDSDDH